MVENTEGNENIQGMDKISEVELKPKEVESISYETIIDELGGFGHWQRCIFLFIIIPDIFYSFSQMLPVYTGLNMPSLFQA